MNRTRNRSFRISHSCVNLNVRLCRLFFFFNFWRVFLICVSISNMGGREKRKKFYIIILIFFFSQESNAKLCSMLIVHEVRHDSDRWVVDISFFNHMLNTNNNERMLNWQNKTTANSPSCYRTPLWITICDVIQFDANPIEFYFCETNVTMIWNEHNFVNAHNTWERNKNRPLNVNNVLDKVNRRKKNQFL